MSKSIDLNSVVKVSVLLAAILLLIAPLHAQTNDYEPSDQRADANFRAMSNLDGNNVRVSVHNNGVLGNDGNEPNQWGWEWPKNTKRTYIYFISIWLGGKVQSNGEELSIVTTSFSRSSPAGDVWSLQPVPGFQNPDHPDEELARSDDATSWPRAADGGWRDKQDDPVDPGWIGSWNGFFGKNVFNADLEIFFRCSDDLYTRYPYVPDTTDPTRGGLGLLMDVRSLAWTQILINDVTFFINDIKNDGTKRVPKTLFSTWIADLVGGDANDDEPYVDLQTDIAFITDHDRIGTDAWAGELVGLGAIKFIETPGNQYDGIDNDGDADVYPELLSMIGGDYEERVPLFTEDDFGNRRITPGDKIVLIDSLTFERRIIEYPEGGGTVKTLGKTIDLPADGITLTEDTLFNSIDDDLDGLIDERLTLHLERFDDITGTIRPVRYINYLFFEPGDTVKRGFIVAGIDAEQNYVNVAPMIDESRDDGFDNDNDWDTFQDDVGLDGAEETGDTGEGDGVPSSGAGTDRPGEPNIDKTDVSETDLIGITEAYQFPAFSLNLDRIQDAALIRNYLRPGLFDIPRNTGEYDLTVSSGYFPLEPGERQRMAIAVAMAGGNVTKAADIQAAIKKQDQAEIAYEADYRFAQAPLQVSLTAVPGDGKVTLYWDDVAEESVDNFIKRLKIANAEEMSHDFEGYRIYRSTDAAMRDALVITDGTGNPLIRQPIAQFDKDDGITGYHPIDIFGVKYWLGEDTGLRHSFVDSGLTNGQRYFYAVTAYDFGFEEADVSPTETAIRIDVDVQGNILTGTNVAVVRPRAPVAGYLPSEVETFDHTKGTSTGEIAIDVIDPRWIKTGEEYEITFEDTLIIGKVLDVLSTKNFTLKNVTTDSVLIDKSTRLSSEDEQPIIDGFRLNFYNEDKVKVDPQKAKWSDPKIFAFQFSPVQFLTVKGVQNPADYQVIFGDVGISTSKDTSISFYKMASKDVNFKIMNLSDDREVEFAFAEINGSDGKFTIDSTDANLTDVIMFLEPNSKGKLIYTWQLIMNLQPKNGRNPMSGDTLNLYLRKPFLSRDTYNFKMRGEEISNTLAKDQLKNIKVVPNPYIAAESWEPFNTYSSGRGSRELHFINLPPKCTIRIFNVAGELVDKIEHNSGSNNMTEVNGLDRLTDGTDTGVNNGTEIWDMLSEDNLEISYGIYLFHVDAPGIGEKTGTFAIIK
jgi:hypothetical protein